MKLFYKKDIAEIIDRPLRTVTQWIDSGFIVPDVEDSRGKGKPRIFSKRNVIEFAMFNVMSKEMSMRQGEIKYILDYLKGLNPDGFDLENYDGVKDWDSLDVENYIDTQNEIQDFYTSKKWGFSKELTYSVATHYLPGTKAFKRGKGLFRIVKGKWSTLEHGEEGFVFEGRAVKLGGELNENVFWLGTIRNTAIKQFGITI